MTAPPQGSAPHRGEAEPAGAAGPPNATPIAAAAVAVAGLLAGAVLLRPDGISWGAARGVVGDNYTFVILIALGLLLGLVGLTSRYRQSVRGAHGLSPRAERLKDATRVLLPVLGGAVPFALAVLALPHRDGPNSSSPIPQAKKAIDTGATGGDGPSGLLTRLVELGVGLLLLAALVGVLVVLWRQRDSPRAARPKPSGPRPAAGDEEVLAEAVESARRALRGDDARAAVIACYAAMEDSLAASGVARRASDSPTDLLRRAVADGTLREAEPADLTALFREARYSSHPMGDPHLHRARVALDAIAAVLAERALLAAQETEGAMSA